MVAAWRVAPGASMVLVRVAGAFPAVGVVAGPRLRGAFRAVCWGGSALLAMRVVEGVEAGAGAAVTLRSEAGSWSFVMPAASGDVAFGQLVAGCGADAAGFLLDTLRPSGERDVSDVYPHVSTMLRAYLSAAAQPDGCIEIMACVPGGCVMLQGWGAAISGPVRVMLGTSSLPVFAAQAGGFARTDVALPAAGVMLVLPAEAAAALAGVDHVFVLSEAGLHGRALVEHRLLDASASLGHVRHMLPALRGPAAMLRTLREALRPRYDGRDTLTGGLVPVRAALDAVLASPGAGAYVSGWVFDPRRLLAAVHLCGSAGFEARVDEGWTRVRRPDVSEVYRGVADFPAAADDMAGFAVGVAVAPAVGEALHLRFTFADGDRAFLPVQAADPADAVVRARVLAAVDLYKPSGLAIVERQLAPLLARVRAAPGRVEVVLAGPEGCREAVVTALADPVLPRALLSGFLHDRTEADEQLVLVCGPAWTAAGLDGLRELVAFHALPATIVCLDVVPAAAAALAAAAQVCPAERLLLAAPGVSGREAGWRRALREGLGAAAFACPTVLYEDWSIRWAGSAQLRFRETAPYAEAAVALAGLPAGLAAAEGSRRSDFGTLECCLVARRAVGALEGEGAMSTAAGQEAAFFGRLQEAGMAGLWVPSVQVYAPEEAVVASAVETMADGWMLRRAWRGGKA